MTKSYNIEVANAHGYKIVLVDGKQTSVKVSDQPIKQDGIKPYQDDPQVIAAGGEPVVGGSCGVSFLYYTAKGNRKADVYTGFDVWPAPAIEFYWEVSVTDSIGTGVGTWGYPVNNWNWETYWETSHGPTGYSLAKVSGGWALLANGQVCYSGGPWQDTNLY
ncbi:hypothetical protein LX83_003303 [Goodfellowiella coeruleoviolacea]|uniref:Uncharacterized protein n=1 Tax=Goodfellowiella coeruleoviolacea TaxID=334858 RepID=A0AAE3GE22_9PSEU|nr:hypothetical protein [Goodfellowiella coeruleoviolacea]